MANKQNRSVQHAPARGGRIACAIYTRKSSEEGLEQAFNSLDAQREACEAYIQSQKHEGWRVLPKLYDDAGLSGGTMERPALKRLLADIAVGEVHAVIVYKVDRLTRSLADFAKIVEIFDANKVSFVSITQAFNTSTSMGRLTLNVLLSFAQFEREVTGERIRDKIAASKKKGLWMGGWPSLGYDVRDRKLVVNEAEAETVRLIFRRYLELGSVRELQASFNQDGIVSKRRIAADGSPYGGQAFSRGALYLMLQNRLYRGLIVHKGAAYLGEHASIVTEDLWQQVQQKLEANSVERQASTGKAGQTCLLTGILFDAAGGPMTPTHAVKKGVRYRYYVSRKLITETKVAALQGRCAGQRLPAVALERLVLERIRAFFADPKAIAEALGQLDAPLLRRALDAATNTSRTGEAQCCDRLRPLIARAQVHTSRIDLELRADLVASMLLASRDLACSNAGCSGIAPSSLIKLSIPAELKRAGVEMKFVIDGAMDLSPPDASLVSLLIRAHCLGCRIAAASDLRLEDAAAQEGISASYTARLMRLNYLAPDIVAAILNGRQPAGLTARKLMADTRLPLEWSSQRTVLGLA